MASKKALWAVLILSAGLNVFSIWPDREPPPPAVCGHEERIDTLAALIPSLERQVKEARSEMKGLLVELTASEELVANLRREMMQSEGDADRKIRRLQDLIEAYEASRDE